MNTEKICTKLTQNIKTVISGKDEIIEKMIISLICGGHILLEDMPGPERLLSQNHLHCPQMLTSGGFGLLRICGQLR